MGDVYLDKIYSTDINLTNYVFNLEYPLSSRGNPHPQKINLIQSESFILETFGKYPVAVCLANNHIMDYGEEAFLDTLTFLNENGIKSFGCGSDADNFSNPIFIEIDGRSLSLAGYSCRSTSAVFGGIDKYGSAEIQLDRIKNDLNLSAADYKIVQLHWGAEDVPFPRHEDVELAHEIIDLGADLILGHHAHVVQSIEKYNEKWIFYGLGNCIFPNFNIKSYHDGKKFTRYSSKEQGKVNKQSLYLELTSNFDITVDKLLFEKGVLKFNDFAIPKYIPKTKDEFIKAYDRHKKHCMIRKLISAPRVPSISDIKRFLSA